MKNWFLWLGKRALNGVVTGFFIILTIASVAYASLTYNWSDPTNIRGRTTGNPLTASGWNILVGNVDNLNERVTNVEGGAGTPSGAIMAFNLSSCPTGWTECIACRGRFLRGLDNGAGLDTGRTLASTQEDVFKDHSHTASSDVQGNHGHTASSDVQGSHAHDAMYRPSGSLISGANFQGGTGYGYTTTTGTAGAHSHNIAVAGAGAHSHNIAVASTTGGSETRPKNIAFLYCIKN